MNILILGSGGREHALAWNISKSQFCNKLFIAPGNAGTALCGHNVKISYNDFDAIAEFSEKESIGMIVVGPEEPLVNGIVDKFADSGIKVVGPAAEAAQLEGSKAFAKKFMKRHDIPTAGYEEFSIETLQDGLDYIENKNGPFVLKADGLAAGKGVLIINEKEEAKRALADMLNGKFGNASAKVVIEDFLSGLEFSVFALTDGKNYKILPEAKDYKRISEGDKGLNTGGMGAISPVPFVDESMWQKVESKIIRPTIEGLDKEGFNYKGFVFFGLINVEGEPHVIEYNCRMGDPETEVVIPRLQNDLVPLFSSLFDDSLSDHEINMDPRVASTVMLVSGGYPEAYEKGKKISGLERSSESLIFYAGAQKDEQGDVLTAGGRVLAVTSLAESMEGALRTSYETIENIDFEKKNYRKDIGFDLR